ncbi:hypothetical protein Pint_30435 [Pistacia integerrima]|uniref:Uncharacterized protein n=1 Tax=Pistacia integerrima TaxID=434235 RepID=A0ACC0X1G1_9ROSI|nr:hypothetical protein Pint_30435 [Pistacia integerrima]
MSCLIVRLKMHLVALLVFHLDILETMYTMLVLLGLANVLNIEGRRRAGVSYANESASRFKGRRRAGVSYANESASRFKVRSLNLHTMLFQSDELCFESCRMNRALFDKLCNLFTIHGNLKSTRHSSVEELVRAFLHVLAHNQKTRVMKCQMRRSTETVSHNFHLDLNVMLRLHTLLFKKLEPIPKNLANDRWKWFKNYLGALDGTYIKVYVPADDIPRYRSRKNEIARNVLDVCTPDMQFIYVLLGWEGSAVDDRVLKNVITRRNGLKVPQGNITK